MKHRILVAGMLLAMVLVAARWALRPSAASGVAADEARAPAASSTLADSVAPAAPERAAVDASPLVSTAETASVDVRVRVIEKETKTPVVGAAVRWISWSSMNEWPAEADQDRGVRDRLFAKSARQFETDERGEVRVPRSADGAQIDAEKDELAGAMRIQDQREVVLELERSPVLDGFVLVDPFVNFNDLLILCLDGNGGNTPNATPIATSEPQRGHFAFRSVSRGSVELMFLTGSGALLARIENVGPRLGSRDPRLDPVDLRGRLHIFEVRVLDEFEQPIAFGYVSSRPSSSAIDWRTTRIVQGAARVVDTAASIDLVACAPHSRPERVAGVSGATTIHVRAGYRIRLSLASAAMLPRSPYRLQVTFEPNTHEGAAEGGNRWIDGPLDFSADGTLAAVVDRPGSYQINWSIALSRDRPEHNRAPIPQSTRWLAVKDEDGEQSFELSLDPKLVDAAIDELERRRR